MTPRAITVRLAEPRDAQAIALMSRDFIEAGLGWKYDASRVMRAIRDRETLAVVACDARSSPAARGAVNGFAIMEFGEERAHLVLLAVRPSHRRTGIGQRMLERMLAARVERIDRHRRRHESLQQRHQAPGAYFGSDDEGGLERDARALRGDFRQQVAVIGMQAARDAHAALRARAVAEAPDVARAHVLVGEAIVLRQVLGCLRRTVLREVVRRRARHEARL